MSYVYVILWCYDTLICAKLLHFSSFGKKLVYVFELNNLVLGCNGNAEKVEI